MANLVYNYFKKAVMAGSFNMGATSGTFPMRLFCMLVGSGYTADSDTHIYRTSVTNEITGTYTAGGFALSSPLLTQNDTTNQGVLDASDCLLATVTFGTAVRAAVLYGSSGLGAASDPLVAYLDFGSDLAVSAGTFQIQWNASGILAFT
jgi:hypothetical protein